MKAVYPDKPLKIQRLKSWFTSKRELIKSLDRKEAIITIPIGLTILLFMYTGVSKLLEYDKFVFQMRLAPLSLMYSWAPIIAWVVPTVELILVVLLYLDRTRLLGMVGSFLLMMSFQGYIIWIKLLHIQTGVKLPCTCGGIISKMSWTTHLLFNAVFVFLLGLSIYYVRQKKKLKDV